MLFRERQQIVILAAAVAIVGSFFVLRYLPLGTQRKRIAEAKAAQELVINAGQAATRELPALNDELEQLERYVGDYESRIPEKMSVGSFLQRIAALMNEYDLKEQAVTPGEEIEAERLRCIRISMQCKGRLDRVFEFHRRLQNMDRVIRIERVSLLNDSDFSGEVRMETKAVIYYRTSFAEG